MGKTRGATNRVKAIIYTEHNIVERYHPLTKLGNVLTYPLNDAMIAISTAVQRSMKKWVTARKKKIYTIHNAIDFVNINAWR